MKGYIDLFADINELFTRLIALGEIVFRLTRPHKFNFTLEENALSKYPLLVTVENRAL